MSEIKSVPRHCICRKTHRKNPITEEIVARMVQLEELIDTIDWKESIEHELVLLYSVGLKINQRKLLSFMMALNTQFKNTFLKKFK